MNPVTAEQFDLLTREELRALLRALVPELEALRQRVAGLEAENQQLKQLWNKATRVRHLCPVEISLRAGDPGRPELDL